MKFIGDLTQDEKGLRVGFVHNMPFDEEHGLGKTEDELRQIGALVDEIPDPERIDGKIAVLYYNPQTNTVFYEYIDKPLTPEEQIQQLINANAELTYQLMMKGVL